MHHQLHRRAVLAVAGALLVVQWTLLAQTSGSAKRPLSYDVVDSWRSIQGTKLSKDGQWLAYALTAQGEDGELVVRNLRNGAELRHARGTNPSFTPDGKFVVFTIAQLKADEEKERQANRRRTARGGSEGQGQEARENQPPRNQPREGLGIMPLPAGQVTTVDRVGSFKLPEESSAWVAYYKGASSAGEAGRGGRGGRGRQGGPQPETEQRTASESSAREKRKEAGSDLILRSLTTGEEVTIPEVTEYTWDKKGTWLAYAVSSRDEAKDGAFARRVSDGTVRALHTGRGHYKHLTFDTAGNQLAFVSDQAEYEKPVSPYQLYFWKAGDDKAIELVSAATRGMLQDFVVSEHFTPRFSNDGARLYLGTVPRPSTPPDADADTPEPISVDVWHWKDPLLQPMQRVRAQQERERNYRAVVHLADKRLVQLATLELPTVNPGDDPDRIIGTSDLPYRQEISWDQAYNDIFIVDLKSGQPRRVLEHWAGNATMSPGGTYLLYFDERSGDWFTHRMSDGQRVNLTEKIDTSFQQENNTPDLPGPYGTAGWTADDRTVLLYDKFDIWEMRPDGSNPRMVTGGEGRRQQLVFRYRTFDPEERTIPTGKPLLLSTTDDRTRATGFYRVTMTGSAAPEKVVMLDKAFGNVTKADNADVVVFTLSRFEEFPDLWVSDSAFRDMQKVSNANPQQPEFTWGRSEIIEYVNADGKRLRAILTKPENFDPAKKYPLMVYIYEELTQGLHNYVMPNVGHSINTIRYVSNGYVLLRPDIVYDVGYPGESAEKCVIPAVNTVMAMGFIDPKRIGIQGHSWGGYQITHLITRTNMFAAVQAGASVSNMISAYGGIRWGTGMSRAFQYEKTQSRIGAPPWDAPLQFIENSPIFWVEKVKTPYLSIHNDEDDAVPWYQGIEFFTAMRRLGKEAYMFNYNSERHGLRNRDNMKHWTVHMDEFFDHYLLGAPRPEWMDKGVPFLDRGKRDVSPLFKRKPAAVTTPTTDK